MTVKFFLTFSRLDVPLIGRGVRRLQDWLGGRGVGGGPIPCSSKFVFAIFRFRDLFTSKGLLALQLGAEKAGKKGAACKGAGEVYFTLLLQYALHRSLHAGSEANLTKTEEMNAKDRSHSDAAQTWSEAGATPPFDARCVTGSVESLPPLMEFPSPVGRAQASVCRLLPLIPRKFGSVLDSRQGERRMKRHRSPYRSPTRSPNRIGKCRKDKRLRVTRRSLWPWHGAVLGWSDPTFAHGSVAKVICGSLQPTRSLRSVSRGKGEYACC